MLTIDEKVNLGRKHYFRKYREQNKKRIQEIKKRFYLKQFEEMQKENNVKINN